MNKILNMFFTGLLYTFVCILPAMATPPQTNVITLSGDFNSPSPVGAPTAYKANVLSVVTSPNPSLNISSTPTVAFQTSQNLVIERVEFTQKGLPTDPTDPTTETDGDWCIYARTQSTAEPGPSELHCSSNYSVSGTSRRVILRYPSDAGLFFPANSNLSCANSIHRSIGVVPTVAQAQAATWACSIYYHIASSTEPVVRIARIPYLDYSATIDSNYNTFPSNLTWLKGWDDPTSPFLIRGFSRYQGLTGLSAKYAQRHLFSGVCLIKRNASDGAITQQLCADPSNQSSQSDIPIVQPYEATTLFSTPMQLSSTDRLSAQCFENGAVIADCSLYVMYQVNPSRRIASVADYYWDLGQIDASNLTTANYCSASSISTFSPAGLAVLGTILNSTSANINNCPTAQNPLSDSDKACACQELFKSFP